MKTRCLLFGALALAFGAPVSAQTWPAKPVTMVISYAAGSGTDIVGRFLAEGLRERTGQPFVVENRPGAFGIVGAQALARAAPDGYSMLFTPVAIAINVHLFKNLGYDAVKDFAPVTTVGIAPFVLLVNPATVPVKSIAELTDYIKARPGQVAYGSASASGRVAAELYLSLAGLRQVTYVPYKGAPQVLADLIGGQFQFMFADATFVLQQARSERVRALAVTTLQRTSSMPDVPTMTESGLPGYDLGGWYAAFMPAKAPREPAQRLAELINATMTTEKARDFLRKLGTDPFPGSPASLATFLDSEIAKWGQLFKRAGIEPE